MLAVLCLIIICFYAHRLKGLHLKENMSTSVTYITLSGTTQFDLCLHSISSECKN